MWICAKCGTQAQQIEVCSGCGSLMRLPDRPPSVSFVLVLDEGRDVDSSSNDFILGPFTTVMEAEQWWDAHKEDERFANVMYHEVSLLENPNDRTTQD